MNWPTVQPGTLDGSTVSTVSDGSDARGALETVRAWLARFISVPDDLDIDLLTLWAAHTHVAYETYSTPRLILDSTMPGSGKTTVLEHLSRLCHHPIQAASISSPALLARMLDQDIRTILIDEVDRSLDPKKPGVEDLIAILNSGYKRGGTRPVLVPTKGGEWKVSEMPTFAPVAMAGNAPNLPDDTRSRSIRVLLMPDLFGAVESSDWEDIEAEAVDIGLRLAEVMNERRNDVRTARPDLPEGCTGRLREKWFPLLRVAAVAGGHWEDTVARLIERDMREIQIESEEGLMKLPPAMVLLRDLHTVWGPDDDFLPTNTIIAKLVEHHPDYWGEGSSYGRSLTPQRMGRLLVQSAKVHSTKDALDRRGYRRDALSTVWRRLGIAPANEPSETVETVEPSNVVVCVKHGTPTLNGLCGRCQAGVAV